MDQGHRDKAFRDAEDYFSGRHRSEETINAYNAFCAAWKKGHEAGAESMRGECIKKVYGMCESDNVAARTVDAIRKIEA